MNSAAQSNSAPRRLAVQWLDASALVPLAICWRRAPIQKCRGRARLLPSRTLVEQMTRRELCPAAPEPFQCKGRRFSATAPFLRRRRPFWGLRAFTLLELMMVITIIGFIAAMTLPHLGVMRANSMTAATLQMLDDVAYAKQRAMVNRSTVYMVFAPPGMWTNQTVINQLYQLGPAMSNMVTHQYAAYALISLGSVGDQPGRHYPRYLTDWRVLPQGVFFAPFEFNLAGSTTATNIYTTNTFTGVITITTNQPWPTNSFPFPSLAAYSTNIPYNLPYIGFTPQGSLTTPYVNQYIALARGSVFYPQDTNGFPLPGLANWVETPAGNDTSNPNLIQIDWMTARPTLVQNKFQ